MGTFDGKVAIVTGGAYGIGRATALEFAKEGAAVAIADINEEVGRMVEADLRRLGVGGLLVTADLARLDQCRRVVSETVDAFGAVDILFNNVGIQSPTSYLNVEDTPEELWDRIVDVNLKSYYMMSKFAIPEMRKRGRRRHHQHRQRPGPPVPEAGPGVRGEQGRGAVPDAPDGIGLRRGEYQGARRLPRHHRHRDGADDSPHGARRHGRDRRRLGQGASHRTGRAGGGYRKTQCCSWPATRPAS